MCAIAPATHTDSAKAGAEPRIPRVKALRRNLVTILSYLLARYPDTFPAMLDDAPSTLSPKADH